MTPSNGNIFRVTGHLCGEFTGPRECPAQSPVTLSFDIFFDLRLYNRLSKQSWGWWFEMPSRPLWRHCNVLWHWMLHCFSIWSLTQRGRVTHICVGTNNNIGSDNGLSPGRRQAIIWTYAGILLIGPLWTNFSGILSKIHTFSFKKMHFKTSSAK